MPFGFLGEHPLSEAERLQRYEAFLRAVRSELAPVVTGLDNLKDEMEHGQAEMKNQVQRLTDAQTMLATKSEMNELRSEVSKAVASTYNREIMDLKLKERDERILDLEEQLVTLQKSVGSIWQNAAVKIGTIFALILSLYDILVNIFNLPH